MCRTAVIEKAIKHSWVVTGVTNGHIEMAHVSQPRHRHYRVTSIHHMHILFDVPYEYSVYSSPVTGKSND